MHEHLLHTCTQIMVERGRVIVIVTTYPTYRNHPGYQLTKQKVWKYMRPARGVSSRRIYRAAGGTKLYCGRETLRKICVSKHVNNSHYRRLECSNLQRRRNDSWSMGCSPVAAETMGII